MRYRWFIVWYLGGTFFVLLVHAQVNSAGVAAPWSFAIGFAVLFLLASGVNLLVRAVRNQAGASTPPARPPVSPQNPI